MDISTIIVGLISLLGTLGGSWMGVKQANRLVNWRIDQLESKVNKHNNLVERVYRLEEAESVFDEKLKVANHRIDDLERMK